jgi:hypothetical protein
MIHVTPKPGFKIVDPSQLSMPDAFLPPEGRLVEESGYWTRRLNDEDVTLGPSDQPDTPAL